MAFKPPGLSTSPASSSLPNPAQHPTHELQFILCNSSPSHTSSGPSSESVSSYDTNVGQPFQVCLIGPYSDPSAPQRLASLMKMAPAQTAATTGPHPSYINVAQVYLFQQQLNGMMVALGTNANREDTFRLQGVQWINDVRTALQLYASLPPASEQDMVLTGCQAGSDILHGVALLPQVQDGASG